MKKATKTPSTLPQATSPFPQAYKDYMRGLTEYFRNTIFHNEYKFDIVYHQGSIDDRASDPEATINVDTVYLCFTVQYSGRVLETVCHEVCHILTTPMKLLALEDVRPSQYDAVKAVDERQTERISNSIMWCLPEDRWTPAGIKKYTAR